MEVLTIVNAGLQDAIEVAKNWSARCEWLLDMVEKYPDEPFYRNSFNLCSECLLEALNSIDEANAKLDRYELQYCY